MFVTRSGTGQINGVYNMMQYPDQESLPDNDPAILAFLAGLPAPVSGATVPFAVLKAMLLGLIALVADPAVKATLTAHLKTLP